jgi:hypothetical protein
VPLSTGPACGQLAQASPKPLACQENDEGPITPGELGTSDLALKHDELLTKQGILHHEL